MKYLEIPDNLNIITAGKPIYNTAQVFFKMNEIKNFDLHQVIGVFNKDEVSVKYRQYKQVEEHLNRTYKQNYYGNGYTLLIMLLINIRTQIILIKSFSLNSEQLYLIFFIFDNYSNMTTHYIKKTFVITNMSIASSIFYLMA